MAVCPKCQGDLGLKAAVCPHCGYDFPPPPERRYTPVWQLVLIVAVTVAVLIAFDGNPVLQVVTGICGVLFWLGVFLDVWRFFKG
jgi:hypothetical protein